ncbi:hypothetical protein ACLB2K_063656 [Fragaria x ananassa]
MFCKLCVCCCIVPIVIFGITGVTFGLVMSKWMNKDDYAGPVYTVDDAVLNKFSVTSNKTLEYELALTLNAENKCFANTEMKWEVFETVPVYENNELGNKVV